VKIVMFADDACWIFDKARLAESIGICTQFTSTCLNASFVPLTWL